MSHPTKNIFLQPNFLTPEECQTWIAKSEAIGYEKAGISRGQQQVVNLKVRNKFTFLIYLNDDYEGGQTKFQDYTVEPKMKLRFSCRLVRN